jgi:murein DD-endopeptidase MepM/ murein hydrolase activator NlpD
MSLLRVTAWTLLGCAAAFIAFLIATVRVVEPRPEAPAAPPAAASAPAARPALIVPVAGVDRSQLRRDWGDARGGGARTHQGLDIMAPGGTPVLAAADGTVEKLFYSNGGGGITLYQRSSDGRWTYYYAHLAGYAANIAERQRLRAGQTIGYVGDTGNAGAGNTHLHFGIAAMAPGERWWQGTPVDPYPLLAGARAAR